MAKNNHFYFPFEKELDHYDSQSIENLSEYQKYQLSFHPERPKYLDYLSIFSDVNACLESDEFGANLIQIHRASFILNDEEIPVMLIGQQSGPTSNYKTFQKLATDPEFIKSWNHGMPTPASYEKAIEAVAIANNENRLIIVFVDTPGADPTEESEAGGIAWKIGGTIKALVEASVPTISVIINRGCSGGAIALTGTDITLAMENSTYLVITPEACSSILYHDRHHANEAAEISQITSKEGLSHGIVDELVAEPQGPAHRFPQESVQSLKTALIRNIKKLKEIAPDDVFENRVKRWSKMGQWDKGVEVKRGPKSRIPKSNSNGFIKRHGGCRDQIGRRVFDPVSLEQLTEKDFVCDVCGHRYIRLSAWDYIDLILDKDSFIEHRETAAILDKDILKFPGYGKKLMTEREKTGLPTAMITGDGQIDGKEIVFCTNDFGFLGGSFCMSTGEKIWRAAEIAINKKVPMVLQAAGGGARMHAGCSSMVSIPKAQLALTRVERAGLPVVTIITDPTLGGVAIGYGSRGIRLFESGAGNIGFSGKRVIEQYTGHAVSKDFQTTSWLTKNGHADQVMKINQIRQSIIHIIL
ncbi:MAG: acetyl-CoA carboxylase carboxyl transferase subunit alpha/beta [Candidatus Marinimicrobia bacterium]|nr:acetyl-CoA carboxylase carboxyl transferase subunit alpha/beta [Candidatus Neomarinimicrobiota bacterium]MBL7010816.1 acetyl-CoA carboxylase carboxyl transferase subunit alpha/beta [Candidatus Neomarinimicrobiota bacterium]MBL7031001.1 acetyl-CoA carboxylase carboxyl transferase subunit alpha/beta [Candidatus Neomarinimicrobiota bacterium]